MGNGFDMSNFLKGFGGWCMQFEGMLPFLGQTLWQGGPPPWMLNCGGSVFQNMGMGVMPYGDYYQSTTGGGGGSASSKFDKLYKLLKKHADNIEDNTKAEILKNALKEFKNLKSNEKTTEKYEELLELYNEYKEEIQLSKLGEKGLTSENNVALNGLNLDNLEENLEDYDILEVLSAWNSNSATKDKHLVQTLIEKHSTADDTTKTKYEKLVGTLHEELAHEAETLKKSTKMTSETKDELKKAIEDFGKFEELNGGRLSDTKFANEYAKAFDNLYRACRKAEAEIIAKEFQEEVKFLGEDADFDPEDISDYANKDLKNENLRRAETKIKRPTKDDTDKYEEPDPDGDNGGNVTPPQNSGNGGISNLPGVTTNSNSTPATTPTNGTTSSNSTPATTPTNGTTNSNSTPATTPTNGTTSADTLTETEGISNLPDETVEQDQTL